MSSDEDSSLSRTVGQPEIDNKCDFVNSPSATLPNHQQEFFLRLCIFLDRLLLIFSEELATSIGRRFASWSGAVVLPQSGIGDLAAVAAYLDLSLDGARKHLDKNGITGFGSGKKFYRLDDLSRASTP